MGNGLLTAGQAFIGSMICDQKDRLFETYKRAVEQWLGEVQRVSERVYCYDPDPMVAIEEKRFRAFLARAKYVKHVAEHGC